MQMFYVLNKPFKSFSIQAINAKPLLLWKKNSLDNLEEALVLLARFDAK